MHQHKKHLFFDLDDTVTLSRSRIDDDMYELLKTLPHDIVIISGAQSSQIRSQIHDLPAYVLGQNGNEAFDLNNHSLWFEKITPEHEVLIKDHINAVKAHTDHEVSNEHDLIEHRGAQISYSLIGHNQDVSLKKQFDPDRAKRASLLAKVPFDNDHIEVKIGGSTCFDYFLKGKHKGHNVTKLIEHQGWDKNACVYFGDALTPGGNDEVVIGVIDTVPVTDHRDTYKKLREFFLQT
jgi:phosphomannomutase